MYLQRLQKGPRESYSLSQFSLRSLIFLALLRVIWLGSTHLGCLVYFTYLKMFLFIHLGPK